VGAIVAAVKKDWSWFFGAVVLSIGIGIMITIITKSFTAVI
jgi:conjugal transfer pilus assembly protein TraA